MRRRGMLGALLAAPVCGVAWAAAGGPAVRGHVVRVSHMQRGAGVYPDVAAALAAAPAGDARYTVRLDAGSWDGRIEITRANVTLVGAGADRTILTHGLWAAARDARGEAVGTIDSATCSVRAPGFAARNLCIANHFDYRSAQAVADSGVARNRGLQAVALLLDAGSDDAQLQRVALLGYQDTLCANAGSARLRDCLVAGCVDFIFGAAGVDFDRCELRSRAVSAAAVGIIAAPSTLRAQARGFRFRQCRLTREAGVADGSVSLARAWRPTRTFSDGRHGDPDAVGAAVFVDCWMDAHIAAARFAPMDYTARDGSRVTLPPGDARFSENGSHGPGAG